MEFMESLPILHLQLEAEGELPAHLTHNYISEFNKNFNGHSVFNNSLRNFNRARFIQPATSSSDCDHGKEPEDSLIVDQAHSFNPVSTEHVTEELPLRLPTWGIVILVIGYALVFIFGVIGNCSVLVVVKRLRRMKTVTNYFIFNLAVADLLVLLFCLLPNLVSNIFIPWVLGSALCKIVPYIQGVSVCASIYFLVAISVERCISIQWPLKYQITKEKAKFVILAIWLWSCIVALPWSIFFQSGPFDPDNPSLEFCIEIWPDSYQNWSTYYFLIGNLFLCYVFPLTVILLCYLTIWFRVYRRPVPSDSYHKAMELIHQRSKTAVIKMLIVVVLIFALSWMPLYGIIIRVKFGSEPSDLETLVISFVYPVAQWLGCFNSCINPIVYSFLNNKFRRAFLSIILGKRKTNKIKIKHKSPTVNLLLKRFSTYRVKTTKSNNDEDSSDSI